MQVFILTLLPDGGAEEFCGVVEAVHVPGVGDVLLPVGHRALASLERLHTPPCLRQDACPRAFFSQRNKQGESTHGLDMDRARVGMRTHKDQSKTPSVVQNEMTLQ